MSLRIKIWGARGSLPSPVVPTDLRDKIRRHLEDFFAVGHSKKTDIEKFFKRYDLTHFGGFGGNTPCLEINSSKQQIIIDGGSGIRQLGYELMAGPCGQGKGEIHLLFTHFHWDHLIGLPFFTPLFVPGNDIHVYAVQPDLQNIFETIFKKPYFPVPLKDLGAAFHYHRLEPRKPKLFKDIKITPYQLDHPDPCWGYKVECNGRIFSHCVDTEGLRVTREELGQDLPLYQEIDLMVFDAQYTLMETIEKINWGHAAASLGLDIAMREGVKRVLFMHHDPASSDEKILQAEAEARRYYQTQIKASKKSDVKLHDVDWIFAHEGLEVEV